MKTLWNFVLNVFLNVTKRNFKRMLSISNHHDSALNNENADPFIQTLYDRFHPLHVNYVEKYDNWTAVKGTSRGETSRLTSYMKQVPQKLREWDVKVQNVFLEKTPDYEAIFSKGKTVFYSGTYEQKINELSALAMRLDNYPALAALKTEVETFYALMNEELTIHQTRESAIRTSSDELEEARLTAGKMMYGNLGLLMDHFREDTEHIARFFPLDLIRYKKNNKENAQNNVYGIHLVPRESKEAGISFDATTKFLIFNNGNAAIGIYTTHSIDAPPVTPTFILQPDEEKECAMFDLGDLNNRYMFVVNLNDTEESDVEISVL